MYVIHKRFLLMGTIGKKLFIFLQEKEEGGEEQTLPLSTEKTLQEVNKSIPKLNVPTL